MGPFNFLRRLKAPLLFVLLALWGTGPLLGLLEEAWLHVHAGTPVAETLIEVPETPALRCHHHPEGCPKDCFCPKMEDGNPAAGQASQEPLLARETRLVQCTEGSAQEAQPLLLAMVAPGLTEAQASLLSERALPRLQSRLPPRPELDSPGPVPRA